MAFRSPVLTATAIDPTARQAAADAAAAAAAAQSTASGAASSASSASSAAATAQARADAAYAQATGIIPGTRLAADAIDGMTITGALFRTTASSSGDRMLLDVLNGLRGMNGSTVNLQITPAGVLVAKSATITGELRTAESGARVRIFQESVTTSDPLATTRGALEFHGANGSPAYLRNVSTSYRRDVVLDSGVYASTQGPAVYFSIIPPEAAGPTMRRADFYNLDAVNWNSVANMAGIGTLTADNVSVSNAPSDPSHALRRDYVTTRLAGGSASFSFPAASTVYSQTITFPVPMATVPAVTVSGVTPNPQNYAFSIGGLTNTSFTLYGRATVTGTTGVRWVATAF